MHENMSEAEAVLARFNGEEKAKMEIDRITKAISADEDKSKGSFKDLFKPAMRLVISIGVVVAILQQITGINSVFFYAPMIFEQSGLGTDASFMQAILVGLVNLLFTILAILFIDRLGRKPLLTSGVAGIVLSMFVLAYGFNAATYSLDGADIATIENALPALSQIEGQVFDSESSFQEAIESLQGGSAFYLEQKQSLLTTSINLNTTLILGAILAFVASFAISIGPVMWVLFSELFPNKIRGIAISFVGLINSAVSFLVQWIFPWELEVLGSSLTFLIYGLFALAGLIFIIKVIPETKGVSLEELEKKLVKE